MERQGELAHVARCDTAQTGGRLEPSESCLDSGALVSAPDAFAHKLPFSSDPPISTVAYQVLCYLRRYRDVFIFFPSYISSKISLDLSSNVALELH